MLQGGGRAGGCGRPSTGPRGSSQCSSAFSGSGCSLSFGYRWCCVTPVLYMLPLLSHHLAQDFCTYIVTNEPSEPSPPVHQSVCCFEDTGHWSVHLSPSVSLSTMTTPSGDAPVTHWCEQSHSSPAVWQRGTVPPPRLGGSGCSGIETTEKRVVSVLPSTDIIYTRRRPRAEQRGSKPGA